uniref:VIgL family C1q-related protein 3 isoform 1 n=1 Tax=Littorina littorea TaxID=31216 RepID=A0A411DEL5_LITLI|nr:VIgL family C1q-related protein 3 isoform 1 [Littorina littorea]
MKMTSWLTTFSIVMLSAFGTTWCFEWESLPEPVVYSCVGREVTFPWEFKAGDAEHIRDIRWLFDGIFDSTMMAAVTDGYFLSHAPYSQRVGQLANGGLALSDVKLADAGNYSVEVNVEVEGSLVSHRHSVLLQVGDGLMTQDGTLTASQDPVALWDSSEQQWTIRLTCGRFTFLGQPPVHVIWTTPTMETPASSGYDNGHFYLTLSSPVVGGNYTCHIPHHLLSDVCVTESNYDNPALTARVLVCEVKARMSLLEAEHRTLKADNRELRQQGQVQDDAIRNLTSENTELRQHQQVQDDDIRNLKSENMELRGELQQTLTDTLTHYTNYQLEPIRNEVHSLWNITRELERLHGQRAAQKAELRTPNITVDAPIKMTPLQQTASDYDNTTGIYTVPVSGWYSVAYQLFPRKNVWVYVDLLNNGKRVARAKCDKVEHEKEYSQTCHSSLTLHLQAGDGLWIQSNWAGPYWTAPWDSFLTIVLVTPDQ